jgi:hypothetical protein
MDPDKTANDKSLDTALNSDIDTLYASIGYFCISNKQLGMAPPGRPFCLELGKAWIHDKGNDLRDTICNDSNIRRYFQENESEKDRKDAVLLIADLIVAICGGIPAVYVAALIVKIGLKEWCNASMGS